MLLNLLKEMEEKDSRISADLVPDGRYSLSAAVV